MSPPRRLLITAEQGFGDAIWAARFLPRVKALGGEVVMECQRELMPLLTGLGAVDCFVPKGAALPPADWHCSICSLPGLFTANAADINGAAYLKATKKPSQPFCNVSVRLLLECVWGSSGPAARRSPGLSGEVVTLRPLAFYDAVGKRLAADGAAA